MRLAHLAGLPDDSPIMLNTASLSLDQAPPVSIPFRFFLLAPLFGLAAGLLLLYWGEAALTSRWAPPTLALTHLLTLGLLGMVMCGAMLQMLPVIAGSPVPRVVLVGTLSHLLLVCGILALVGAFLSHGDGLMELAILSLGGGFLVFISGVVVALWRVRVASATITGMRLAIAGLVLTVSFGMLVAGAWGGLLNLGSLSSLTDIHLSWGLLGWIGLLLMSVSFQVVPLFQVTPDYPGWITGTLPRAVFLGILLWMGLRYGAEHLGWPARLEALWIAVLGLAFSAYGGTTLYLQRRRKRRIIDVTLWFWRLAMLCIFMVLLTWIGGLLFPVFAALPGYPLLLGILLLLGVAVPAVNGMLYKILPFLCWFHLQNRQLALMCMTVPVPHMKAFITDRAAKRQFHISLLALLLALPAALWPALFARPAGLAFAFSNLLLLVNLLQAVIRYRQTLHALGRAATEANSH